MSSSASTAATRPGGRALPVLLLGLTVFGPISMDLYLPALPALTSELATAESTAQLTVTACLVGLALGQLVAGPLSDRFGRRRPLYVGVVGYVLASVLCAVSPGVELLVLARLAQGLAGGVGLVISQASGRDLYSGAALIRYYGRVTVLAGLAAIVGPLLGGVLSGFTSWRGLFVLLAVLGLLILLAVAVVHRETLPVQRRTGGGFAQTRRDVRVLLEDRPFVGAVLVQGFVHAAVFAYLSGATYVLQGSYGLSPQQYALAFGLNSLGFMVFGHLGARAAERWGAPRTLGLGLAGCGVGAAGLLAAGLLRLPLAVVVLSLLVLLSSVAVTNVSATTVALADHPEMAGTASSLLGTARYAFGAVSAPLVGLAGAAMLLPLGVVAVVSVAAAAFAAVLTMVRPSRPDPPRPDPQPTLPVGSKSPRQTTREGAHPCVE